MYITFYGATREVTGSMHLLGTENDRILLDCGLFQGKRKESNEKNKVLPFNPKIITNVVLSHAHIDHAGRIPLLTKRNFKGRIVCTRVTADASRYLLPDSAHIQESDAEYLNYKTLRGALSQMKKGSKHEMNIIKAFLKTEKSHLNVESINLMIAKYRLEKVTPLYTVADAEQSLGFFDGYPYRHPVSIGNNISCIFYEAGHILGSAFSVIRIQNNGKSYRICYTGDIGRFGKPILRDPSLDFDEEDRNIDLLIMESTYGNRFHDPVEDLKGQLKDVLQATYNRGGTVLIPAFAYGRTQELIYMLHELYDSGEVPHIPVYVDSPLAVRLTDVFGEHPEVYREEAHQTFLEKGLNPFSFSQMHFISSVDDSMKLMQEQKPHIVLASSGMCEGGRILHHLRYKIHNANNTILIVGYMAQNTLGRRLLEAGDTYRKAGRKGAAPILRFLNKEYPLNAHVVKLGGFSAHADRNEMFRFLQESGLNIKRIAIVHGEEDQSLSFAQFLSEKGYNVFVPQSGETVSVRSGLFNSHIDMLNNNFCNGLKI